MLEAAISGERTLTGPEKAAALLLMMGKPPAARLLKQFDQPDLQAVARAAGRARRHLSDNAGSAGRPVRSRFLRWSRPV